MLFQEQRSDLRQVYFTSWQQHLQKQPLEPLAKQIVAIVLEHPEYQALLAKPEQFQDKDYLPEAGETNPFLHLGLHMGVREQVQTDRPVGITKIYHELVNKLGDAHTAEHKIMDCLVEQLWLAQRDGVMPDEQAYMQNLRALLTA